MKADFRRGRRLGGRDVITLRKSLIDSFADVVRELPRAELEALDRKLARSGPAAAFDLGKALAAQQLPAGRIMAFAGEGLGRIDPAAGGAALDALAVDDPYYDWARSTLGRLVEAAHELDVSPERLDDWHRRGLVLALADGSGGDLFPLRQFVDRAPIRGLAQVAARFPGPEEAWEWLVTPNRFTDDEAPIDWLAAGRLDAVEDALEGDGNFA